MTLKIIITSDPSEYLAFESCEGPHDLGAHLMSAPAPTSAPYTTFTRRLRLV